jgi:ferrochelatase
MTLRPSHGSYDEAERSYDAVLYLSFGGPEGPDEVMPFLEHVTRGRGVPRERLEEVAEHYQLFGGVSPINDQNRAVIEALEQRINLPIYWGNRNSEPFVTDTVQRMADNGVKRAICFVTSAFSSYSGCRQYREDIAAAQEAVGSGAPKVDKLRVFFNHPGFIEPQIEKVRAALNEIPEERRATAHLVFSAHSVPVSMAETSSYVDQLLEAARLVSEATGDHPWELAYQSRSGPPAFRGSSLRSATTSRRSRHKACAMWLSSRSVSFPTTWRFVSISTSRPPRSRSVSVSTWCEPRPSGPIPLTST